MKFVLGFIIGVLTTLVLLLWLEESEPCLCCEPWESY